MITKIMNHAEYPRKLRTKTESELYYIVKDCKAAIAANPDNPNNGYYQDEINYVCNEQARRIRQ
jgi:hypothetical protein